MLEFSAIDRLALTRLLAGYGLDLRLVAAGADIPGSYWGESEAGLRGNTVFVRLDTPLHSILHESAHYVCMSPERRVGLDRDAGGDDLEESAVCYLQILLAETLAVSRAHSYADMDQWGYSFRLGSTRAWFEQDAADARDWLLQQGILDANQRPSGQLRSSR